MSAKNFITPQCELAMGNLQQANEHCRKELLIICQLHIAN
jgi:hypothetical protein